MLPLACVGLRPASCLFQRHTSVAAGSPCLCLQLLATAGHVALYDFDIPTKRWVSATACPFVHCCAMLRTRAGVQLF